MANIGVFVTVLGSVASFGTLLYGPITQRFETFGVTRAFWKAFPDDLGQGAVKIPHTYATEDIHYYEPANAIFGITEPDNASRENFFPP